MSMFIYSKSKNKFNARPHSFLTEEQIKFAIKTGFVEVSKEDYKKLKNHELCWENGVLVPYYKTVEEIAQEYRQEKINTVNNRISELKTNLAEWDYKTSKYIDGDYTEQQWAEIVEQRKNWRAEINRLEYELATL